MTTKKDLLLGFAQQRKNIRGRVNARKGKMVEGMC